MKVYELRTRVRLPRPRPELFAFFADAGNLEAITPPWLHRCPDKNALLRSAPWECRHPCRPI